MIRSPLAIAMVYFLGLFLESGAESGQRPPTSFDHDLVRRSSRRRSSLDLWAGDADHMDENSADALFEEWSEVPAGREGPRLLPQLTGPDKRIPDDRWLERHWGRFFHPASPTDGRGPRDDTR